MSKPSLTHKERVRRALLHQPVDRLPTQISYTTTMGQQLATHLGVSLADLPQRLDNHLIRVDLTYPKRLSGDGKVTYDWWGAGWNTETEGYWLADAPLAQEKDLDRFPWPDPDEPSLLDQAAETIEKHGKDYFIIPNFGFVLFERAWSLRGFEAFCEDLVLDPEYAEELLERITTIQVALARRLVALGVDGGYVGDDYGAQQSLLISPRTWRRFIKPRLARIFAVFTEAGLPVIMHSDGAISDILSDLVEIGLTALNPVQPEVLDHDWLAQTFGGRLAFYGGISTQTVLPYGTPDKVMAAVRQCITTLGRNGTGLILAPSHRMTSEIPMANVDSMLAAFSGQTGVSQDE
jgi:uroporphyrinogen decarboxylase